MAIVLKPDYSFTDPAFDKSQTAGHILAIDLSWERLVYSLYDTTRTKFVSLECYSIGKLSSPAQISEKMDEIFSIPSLSGSKFQQVRILWTGLQYTLVPLALFDEKQASAYLQFTQELQAGSVICYDNLKNLQAENVYAIPTIIRETIHQKFPGHHLDHYITVLAESLLVENKTTGNNPRVFVNVNSGFFDLLIINEGKLLLCNTFEYKCAEDFLYYLLFAFEQAGINPEKTGIILMGEILKNSSIYESLHKYICEVNFATRSKAWNYSHVLDELPGHFFYTLLNILTCAS